MLGSERERERDMIPSGLRPVEMLRLPLSCGGGQQLNTPLHVSRRVSLGGVQGAHASDMFGRVMFCVVVGEVDFAGGPSYFKHFLGNAVLKPVKSHVDGLASFLVKSAVEDSIGGTVVST